jgi:hypothetical protein
MKRQTALAHQKNPTNGIAARRRDGKKISALRARHLSPKEMISGGKAFSTVAGNEDWHFSNLGHWQGHLIKLADEPS